MSLSHLQQSLGSEDSETDSLLPLCGHVFQDLVNVLYFLTFKNLVEMDVLYFFSLRHILEKYFPKDCNSSLESYVKSYGRLISLSLFMYISSFNIPRLSPQCSWCASSAALRTYSPLHHQLQGQENCLHVRFFQEFGCCYFSCCKQWILLEQNS